MLTGPFQRLPGASEGWASHEALAHEPWLLPITDGAAHVDSASDAVAEAVARASRKLWLVANAFCLALALLIAAESSTGYMLGTHTAGPVANAPAQAPVLTAPVVTASAS
ncbi:hypothetical protein [Methylobacterium sp. A54F]